ncbi:MAG TPA: thioredoxin-like domain-containing protein [Longimicrobiales bacterium]
MNCLHLLPQLRKLEDRFSSELVVVGVHSGKFIAERVTANIQQAVRRLEVHHPLVNDRQFRVWRSYVVNAWPTLVLIDTEGRVVGRQAGEVTAEALAPTLEHLVARAEAEGTLDRERRVGPGSGAPPEPEPERALAFPAKVLVDAAMRRLFVADTAHHRVLAVRLDPDGRGGELEAVIGRGGAGFADGGFGDAAFDRPHGLTLEGGIIYVADTWNHAIRAVDLVSGWVDTVAGTGEQARRFDQRGRGRDVALNSPWDVWAQDGSLYIAMAGSHQIWRLDLATAEAAPWAGSSIEEIHDGPRPAAALAQPSGLAGDGRRIFFADSESSAVRWADPDPGGRVHTVVGTGLFDFGDRDGIGDAVRLQHPLGIAWHDGRLYVADTYNSKIKMVDPETREARTLLGGEGVLWEPGGLTADAGTLYIADTNHHRIVAADLAGEAADEFRIRGIEG